MLQSRTAAAVPVIGMRGSDPKIIWITGANGLIGHYLARTAAQSVPEWTARALTRNDFDLLDFAAIRREFKCDQPQLIVHCAAISQTAACERDPALARRVNVEATALLAELAADIPFLFFSTDLVFDGQKGNYEETAPVNPLTVYAQTKVAAERLILANPRHAVVRTSLNAGISKSGARGFNEEWRKKVERGETLQLFTDEFRSPIHARETARAVWELAKRNACGLYHLAGAERLSRFEMGKLLAARWPDLHPKIEPMSIKDFHGPRRAPDTSLDCTKAQKLLPVPLPRFSKWLAEYPEESI